MHPPSPYTVAPEASRSGLRNEPDAPRNKEPGDPARSCDCVHTKKSGCVGNATDPGGSGAHTLYPEVSASFLLLKGPPPPDPTLPTRPPGRVFFARARWSPIPGTNGPCTRGDRPIGLIARMSCAHSVTVLTRHILTPVVCRAYQRGCHA